MACSRSYIRSSAAPTARSAAFTCFSNSFVPPGRLGLSFFSRGACLEGAAASAVNRPSLPWIAPSAASSEPLASAGAALRGSGDDRPASLAAAEIDGGEATYEVIDEMSEELL